MRTQALTGKPQSRLAVGIVLGTITAIAPFSIDMYLPALPDMAADFGASASFTQLSLTLFLVGLALGQLIAGPVSDALGRRTPLIVGMTTFVAISLLCALATSINALLILRFLQGLAGAAGLVIARAIARDSFDGPELTKFYALLTLIGGAGPIVAPLVGGQLLLFTSWQGVFVALAVFGACITFTVIISVPESLPQQARITGGLSQSLSTMTRLLQSRDLLGYSITQGLMMGGLFAYISGSSFIMQDIYEVTPQTFSLLFALNGSGFILGAQGAARLVSRFEERSLLLTGLIISSGAGIFLLLGLLFKASLYWVIPPLFLTVFSVGIISTTSMSLALQKHKQSAGSAAGLLGVIGMLFGAAISPLAGLGGSESAAPLGLVIAACSIGAMLSYLLLVRRLERSIGYAEDRNLNA
ncbi:multidrug effflux MFS transporter [Paenibacillus abyssi]|uniref:Bcr/CflA family efflux transporter n=1 Tax=Paenibacillus abyssi TaxID=1340531 RepID=A0A917G5F6_9BACL|nr:multidrug effflux MFS transporter [Paenibacillus abyssi]GGG22629.1 Bcr/CflA family drug resistance efflux transporter [Paenibacillus abyssi]